MLFNILIKIELNIEYKKLLETLNKLKIIKLELKHYLNKDVHKIYFMLIMLLNTEMHYYYSIFY